MADWTRQIGGTAGAEIVLVGRRILGMRPGFEFHVLDLGVQK